MNAGDDTFKRRCVTELRELIEAVEHEHGRPAVRDCMTFKRRVVNPAILAHGFSIITSALPSTCVSNPLNLADWLEGERTSLPRHVAQVLTLYVYVLCIEVRYVYATMANLLGELAGRGRPGDTLYKETSARRCFTAVERLHAAFAPRSFAVIGTWRGFLAFELRDAVAHSDFVLTGTADGVMMVRNLMRLMSGDAAGRGGYPAELITTMYVQARGFLEAFLMTLSDSLNRE